MIIGDRLEFVFIHNPKCAGTALRSVLMPFDTTGNLFWMHDTCNGHKIDKAHMPLFLLKQRFPEYFGLLSRYLTFMAVRNPFTRAISAFNETHQELYVAYAGGESLSRYRYELNRFFEDLTESEINGWSFAHRHFVRQADFCFLGRKRYVDITLRCESLVEDVAKLGLFAPDLAAALATVPQTHQRPIGHRPAELLNHLAVKRIVDLYDRDFALFGYSRSPLTA